MRVDRIELDGFRNYEGFAADFHPGVNVIWGENAQGKTNLLEAIGYLSGARSHRTRGDRDLISFHLDRGTLTAKAESRNRDFLIEARVDCRLCLCNDLTKLHERSYRGTPTEVRAQLEEKGSWDKGEYALVMELAEGYRFRKTEHTVSAEAMLVDAMVARGLSGKEAVAAVLADENNSYSKNELKAALLNLKRLFE